MSMKQIDALDLLNTQTPEATRTWQPIPHIEVHNRLLTAMEGQGIVPVSSSLELSDDDLTAIGRFTLQAKEGSDWAMQAAFWNDHTKRRGVTYAAGESVFICTNGCLFAETKLSTKRTSGVLGRLENMADLFAGNLRGAYEQNDRRREQYANHLVGPEYCRALIVRLAEGGVIPSSKILPVVAEFEAPSFAYSHNPHSILGLQSAVTHIAKGFSTANHHERTLALTAMLDSEVSDGVGNRPAFEV